MELVCITTNYSSFGWQSHVRTFIEGKPVEHDAVSFSTSRDRPNYMLRCRILKLMMGQDEKNIGINALYDLVADPLEMHIFLNLHMQFLNNYSILNQNPVLMNQIPEDKDD